jgi:alcohol dehydrogenase
MLLGAHLAGAAIEHSMLGAAHACANPLTARCGIMHGVAVGIMLPHVVRFNSQSGTNHYAAICDDPNKLAADLERGLLIGNMESRLARCGVSVDILPQLAEEAAKQWTASFNCVPVGAAELLEIYRAAYD